MGTVDGHGGDHVAAALRAHGVDRIYTLIGGHIFWVLDAAARNGLRLIDVRHEQAAAFAAEAHGKLARSPGVVVTDAGPGVMNTVNAVASAASNGAAMLVLAGHPPQGIVGRGALNETVQRQVFEPLVKHAESITRTDEIGAGIRRALAHAAARHRGPVYVDIPMDVLLGQVSVDTAEPPSQPPETEGDIAEVARLLAAAERPLLFIGSDVWADGAEKQARALAEAHRLPVIMNGMGRGILPADHELAISAARGAAIKRADLVVVAGAPLDFRVGFGTFGEAAVVHLADHPTRMSRHAPLAAGVAGSLPTLLESLADAPLRERDTWIAELRAVEAQRRAGVQSELRVDTTPIHPARVYGELVPRLPRDAIVIADGGDFVSFAGKYIEVYEPGSWLDPGPYGCLGTSAGYALGAGLLHPGRRIVVLLGDGAAGFSLADWDSLVRHGVDVTFVCGNNSGWVLEKQPMRSMFGRDVVADLSPETRYDEVMRAFGGHGELVKDNGELGEAIERALATPGPSLVNVIIDPDVSYPRGSSAA